MAISLWCLRRGCTGFDSSADLSCSCMTQVRRGMLLMRKWNQNVCLVMFWSPIHSCIRFSGSATDCLNLSFFSALSALSLATSSTRRKLPWRIQPLAASNSEDRFSGLWITCLYPCISLWFCQTRGFIFQLRGTMRGGKKRVEKEQNCIWFRKKCDTLHHHGLPCTVAVLLLVMQPGTGSGGHVNEWTPGCHSITQVQHFCRIAKLPGFGH